jgi:hypothetical protein
MTNTTHSSQLNEVIHTELTRGQIITILLESRDFRNGMELDEDDPSNFEFMDQCFNDQDLIQFYQEKEVFV